MSKHPICEQLSDALDRLIEEREFWKKKYESDRHTCSSCKYSELIGPEYPCMDCNDMWEPKEKAENE